MVVVLLIAIVLFGYDGFKTKGGATLNQETQHCLNFAKQGSQMKFRSLHGH